MVSSGLTRLYHQLLQEYGNPIKYWPQWCAKKKSITEREKVIIGMILVQRTSWHNADIALKNLKKSGLLSIKKISELKNLKKLTQLIRPAGFYQSKPRRLFDICTFITKSDGIKKMMQIDTENLRQQLQATAIFPGVSKVQFNNISEFPRPHNR